MKKVLAGFLAVVLAGALSGCSFGLRRDYNSVVDENEKLKAEYSALETEETALENKASSSADSSVREQNVRLQEYVKRVAKVLALPESNRLGHISKEIDIEKYNLKAIVSVEPFLWKGIGQINTAIINKEVRIVVDISTNNSAQEKIAFLHYYLVSGINGGSADVIKKSGVENVVTVVNDFKGNPIAVLLAYEKEGEIVYENQVVDNEVLNAYDEIKNIFNGWALKEGDVITREITNSFGTNTSSPAESPSGQIPSNTTSNSIGVAENVIRPEVKEAIDSYEAFIDEYCDFMKKMSQTDNVITMMTEYLEYMQKLSDMGEKFDKIQEGDLTNAEIIYYTEVMLRCTQKIASAAE